MKSYSRVCAEINLDAIAYNMEQLKNRMEKKTPCGCFENRWLWTWSCSDRGNV